MIIQSLRINGTTKAGNTYHIKQQRAICYVAGVSCILMHVFNERLSVTYTELHSVPISSILRTTLYSNRTPSE
jgi:hypothetical protein